MVRLSALSSCCCRYPSSRLHGVMNQDNIIHTSLHLCCSLEHFALWTEEGSSTCEQWTNCSVLRLQRRIKSLNIQTYYLTVYLFRFPVCLSLHYPLSLGRRPRWIVLVSILPAVPGMSLRGLTFPDAHRLRIAIRQLHLDIRAQRTLTLS